MFLKKYASVFVDRHYLLFFIDQEELVEDPFTAIRSKIIDVMKQLEDFAEHYAKGESNTKYSNSLQTELV